MPPEVLAALGEPVIHHRSPDFKAVFGEVACAAARRSSAPKNDVLVFTASGTGAFESAVVNLLSPGEKVLAVSHGELRHAVAEAGGRVRLRRRRRSTYDWGESPRRRRTSPARSPRAARRSRFLVHSETSTGVVSDIQSLVAACNDAGAISVVDAISSLGAVPLETDAWGIDVVVTGSQKALMTPPGLAFASRLASAPGQGRTRDAAALLLGLGERAHRTGEGQHAVHAGDLDRRRAQRGARS